MLPTPRARGRRIQFRSWLKLLEAEKATLTAKVEDLSRELKETTGLWGDNVKELAAVKADKAAQDQVVEDLTLEKGRAATDLAAQDTEVTNLVFNLNATVQRLLEAKENSETKNKATLDELKRTLESNFEERVDTVVQEACRLASQTMQEACLSLKRTHSAAFDEALATAIDHI